MRPIIPRSTAEARQLHKVPPGTVSIIQVPVSIFFFFIHPLLSVLLYSICIGPRGNCYSFREEVTPRPPSHRSLSGKAIFLLFFFQRVRFDRCLRVVQYISKLPIVNMRRNSSRYSSNRSTSKDQ